MLTSQFIYLIIRNSMTILKTSDILSKCVILVAQMLNLFSIGLAILVSLSDSLLVLFNLI